MLRRSRWRRALPLGLRSGQWLGRSVAVAFEDEPVGVVSEPVEGGGAEQSVGEGISPFGKVEVGGDNGGGLFVAFGEQVVQIFVLGRAQRLEPEIIDDEDVDAGQGVELAFEGLDGARGVERPEQLGLGGEQHVVAEANGAMAEGLGEMRLAGAGRTSDILMRITSN